MRNAEAIELAAGLCRKFEGFSSTPYICPAGYWTIGYGHLCSKDHPPIDRETGERYLTVDLLKHYDAMVQVLPAIQNESPGRIAALLDFTFNLGPGRLKASTLRKRIEAGDWADVPTQLRRWVMGGGRKLPGLVLRREAEIALL